MRENLLANRPTLKRKALESWDLTENSGSSPNLASKKPYRSYSLNADVRKLLLRPFEKNRLKIVKIYISL